ncbi:MAG TPA: CaiB/BaiF CoA-transferase family protein [Rhodopila sp.]|uniref:CaiB/BaiF CoA transferase family protein n=1 Tax=Rhodopila sp. TaxID=2480087 RepID=UPI002C3E6387|nr:CaiB/BaiF CoA-transferase family protein [Rhodopila sp.]HVY17956.1 CaiB/BaiF CoA-transferase family protein [Rhodopila sp.]
MSATQRATPLAGLKVLEFSHTVMGPTAGLILAELGADVIKVEPAPKGDHTRGLGGFAAGFFAAFSRNKRSLCVDLKKPEGQAIIHRLAPSVDVVLENYGPGTIERLGCGWEQLAPLNDRLIFLALKGYLAGPYEHRPALDEVVQFQTGLAFMTGPIGRPLRAGASVIDIMGAVFGVIAVQAALRERDITGKGQRVGSALFESAAFLMSTHMAGMAATGLEARPMPARRGAWAIYEVFKTAGDGQGNPGQLFIGVTSDQQWSRFVEEFSLQALAADPRLATNIQRLAEREWLIPALQAVIEAIPQKEVEARCERANVSWAPVGQPGDLFTDPHLLATGGLLDVFISRTGGSEGKKVGLPALPIEFGPDRDRPGVRFQSPKMGEHSRQVLEEAGYGPAEIDGLLANGVVVG